MRVNVTIYGKFNWMKKKRCADRSRRIQTRKDPSKRKKRLARRDSRSS